MKLLFVTDARYVYTNDKNVYSYESSFGYELYKRYLKYFSEVIIFARVEYLPSVHHLKENCVTLGNVSVVKLPYYIGFSDYLQKKDEIKRSIRKYIKEELDDNTAIVCRVPGRIGTLTINELRKENIPYGIEVVGDPYDVLSKGSINHPLRPFLRILTYNVLKRVAKNAPAALYVTQTTLQRRYPNNNFSIGVSDVVMPAEAFKENNRTINKCNVRLISVGSLEQLYKAPDVIMKSLKILKDSNLTFSFVWIGDGIYKQEMITMAKQYGIIDNVNFRGRLTNAKEVRKDLDEADLFLMPSRTEGLPRALVEAMARSLPCVATPVGGIPELLDKEVLIPVNDSNALAQKIVQMINNENFMKEQSERNYQVALDYSEDILESKRRSFYEYVKNLYKA